MVCCCSMTCGVAGMPRVSNNTVSIGGKTERGYQEAFQGDKGQWTWSVPSGVLRSVPCTKTDVPVEVKALSPPTSAATSVLTNTCVHPMP